MTLLKTHTETMRPGCGRRPAKKPNEETHTEGGDVKLKVIFKCNSAPQAKS